MTWTDSKYRHLTTPHIADGARAARVALRYGPPALRPIRSTWRLLGPAVPVVHAGSIDVILEAIARTKPGDVMVIDDAERTDRGCIGDQIALEVHSEHLAGIVVNGAHRDTVALLDLDLPVFSIGAHPEGPAETAPSPAAPFESCRLGIHTVLPGDLIAADADGLIIVERTDADRVLEHAMHIQGIEAEQLAAARQGRSLRQHLEFDRYLQQRSTPHAVDFATHTRQVGAILNRHQQDSDHRAGE